MKLRGPSLIAFLGLLAGGLETVLAQRGDIHGIVLDSLTRQRIPFANVTVVGATRGAASNNVGFYTIPKLPPGTYEVTASVLGYSRTTKTVTVREGISFELNFELPATSIEVQGLVVGASRKRIEVESATSIHVLDRQDIGVVPIAGQQDLLQSLQILPGIVSTSDVSSRFYVRGGAGDQNLFLLDGIRIYYPFHALGIFSVFNPNVLQNVGVYTGAFPPGYGGRLSSVVNISTRDGRADRFSAKTHINFLSAEALIEGPAFKNSSWILDVRKSISSQRFSKIAGQQLPVSFFDGTFKLSAQPGGIQKFDFTFLSSGDDLLSSSAIESEYHWRNNGWAIAGSHLPTDNVFLQWLLFGSSYTAERTSNPSVGGNAASTSVKHYGFRTTAMMYTSSDNIYSLGFEFGSPALNYQFYNKFGILQKLQSSFIEVSAWARYEAKIDMLRLDVGIHSELASLLEGESAATALQPRVNFTLLLNTVWRAKASYGRFTQNMLTVGNEDDIVSILDGWIKVPSDLPPEQADHYVLGISGNPTERVSITAEVYYKHYSSLVVYNWDKTNVQDPDYVRGTSDAYGAELLVRSQVSWVDFYGAYSLSWAEVQNRGLVYLPRYDRRHHISLMAVARPYERIQATMRWEFGSGFPFSETVGYIERPFLDNSLPGRFENDAASPYLLLGGKNAGRLPAYHRLDASLIYRAKLFGLDVNVGADLLNVYNNKNIFYFDRRTGQQVNMLSFYPSATLTVQY